MNISEISKNFSLNSLPIATKTLSRWNRGLSRWLSGKKKKKKKIHLPHRRCGFDPWVRKIPWRRKWQPTPVFLPENSTQYSVITYNGKESDKAYIYVCINESLCCTPETNMILWIEEPGGLQSTGLQKSWT